MKAAPYGRIVFGASAVLFGVIALMWHDADTWQALRRLWSLPLGMAIGDGLMIAQIAGGIAIAFPRGARRGSLVLVAVYAIFSLACIPGIVAHPAVFGQYDGFFEQFCLLSGALAVFAVTGPDAARATALRQAARIGLGLSTVSFTLAQAVYLQLTASLVPPWIPPNQMFWAILTTVLFALAAVAILINRQALLAIRLLTTMLAGFGLLVWVPLLVAHGPVHGNWSEFALTVLIMGAAWVVGDALKHSSSDGYETRAAAAVAR
ncbi:MAG: hypothetical protein JO263_05500 [Candidatus Eremiobacteraeota bacterium]|nr:hypothetical protein [Candidatus Eremiobacteraeota bacterium]